MKFPRTMFATTLLISLIGVACGNSTIVTDNPVQAGQPGEARAGIETLTADSSTSDARAVLSPCDDSLRREFAGELPPQTHNYRLVDEWWSVESLNSASDPGARQVDAEITGSRLDLEDRASRNVSIHESQIEEVRWGVENATVYLGVKSDGVAVISVVQLQEGEFVFAGNCAEQSMREHFDRFASDSQHEFLMKLVTTTDADAVLELFSDIEPSVPDRETFVILNPADAPAELLSQMTSLIVFYNFETAAPNTTICSRTGAGWNDCFAPDETFAQQGGVWMEAYVDPSGVLEVFTFGPDFDLNKPTRRLGVIELPVEARRAGATFAARVDLEGLANQEAKDDQGFEIGRIVDLDLVDIQSDDYWAFDDGTSN